MFSNLGPSRSFGYTHTHIFKVEVIQSKDPFSLFRPSPYCPIHWDWTSRGVTRHLREFLL